MRGERGCRVHFSLGKASAAMRCSVSCCSRERRMAENGTADILRSHCQHAIENSTMSQPRAKQLLDLLDKEEMASLESSVASFNRESLASLLAFLITVPSIEEEQGAKRSSRAKNGSEKEKQQMFLAAFGRPWSKDEDYLLRNELRLLTERVYDLIARHQREKEIKSYPGRNDPFLLEGLLNRGAFRPFESLYKKMREDAQKRCDYRTAHRLNEVWFRYLIHYCELTPERMKQAHTTLSENLDNLKQAYRNEVAENQHRRVVCEQNLLVMGQEMSHSTIGPDSDLSQHDTPFARYYDAISNAHASQGEERIAHARVGLEEIQPIKKLFPVRTAYAYAILSSAMFVEQQYTQAAVNFEEGITFCREQNTTPPLEMLFNFASTLMRLGEYQKVLDLMDEYHTEFQARPKLHFRLECFRCFCYIFLNDPAKAFEAIPPDIQKRPESEYHYFRFIYLILPYMNNDPEGALRESRNFLVYFNRHKDKLMFPHEKKLATIYRHFYSVIYNEVDAVKKEKELKKTQEEVVQFTEEVPEYQDYLYVQWLLGAIAEQRKDIKR